MKRKTIWVTIGVVVVALAAFALTRRQERPAQTERATHSAAHPSTPTSSAETKSVPAYYQTEPAASSLAPTLAPEKFTGKAQEAYRVVREKPQLIAQLPCYCYCDRGFGHKSLHSCFVDDHAAHCAVCVDEALLAYNLQKRGLSPQQIRGQIIEQYEPKSAP
ncbi:MAG: CYCXC family (seleno)protein [Acidobacteriota bacterium]